MRRRASFVDLLIVAAVVFVLVLAFQTVAVYVVWWLASLVFGVIPAPGWPQAFVLALALAFLTSMVQVRFER